MTSVYYGPVSNTFFLISFLDDGYVDIDWERKGVIHSIRLLDHRGTYAHLTYIGRL